MLFLGILDSIATWFCSILADGVYACVDCGCKFYNVFCRYAVNLLVQKPQNWGPDAWRVIRNINSIFTGIGTSLVAFFFLLGMYNELHDSKLDVRFEAVLFDFIKLLLAVYFVANSFTIITKVINYIYEEMIERMTGSVSFQLKRAEEFTQRVENLITDQSAGNLLIALLMSFIIMLVFFVCGLALAYIGLKRFIKLMVIIPWGTVACSTLAGGHVVKQSALSFWKFLLCTVCEAVTMLICIAVFAAFFTGDEIGVVADDSSLSDMMYVTDWLLERALQAVVCVGTVSGSGALTQRVLGL